MRIARRIPTERIPTGRLIGALLAVGGALWAAVSAPAGDDPASAADDELPVIRRIYVPVDRTKVWPAGDWQPLPVSELEQALEAARAARRERPPAFLERAEYSATLIDSELKEARLEWIVRRPDPKLSLLSVGRLNLNVSQLAWSEAGSKQPPTAALWGAGPSGSSVIVVNRPRGRLIANWSLPGRRLAASTEFDLELAPAAISEMRLRVPAGLLLGSSAGELTGPVATAEPGWNEWRLHLGSQSTCRLRVAPPPQAQIARPLILVRSNLNYFVRPEAVRLLAEFEMDVLEAGVRELRFFVDPDVQVTAVEYGDDGAVAWQSTPTPTGQEIVVRLPDAAIGEGHTLQLQGIAQVKQFAAWTLPRIRLQNSVEAAGRATLRLQSPFLAADVKTDGYRQLELTAGADDEEVLVFRRFREDGTITIVPTDSKADLTCRAVSLIQPDRHQWSMVSQWEWKAAAGNTFAASLVVSGMWEIVDVRLPPGGHTGKLSGWEVQETEPGRRVLHLYFLNALKPDRPQQVRISARRLPPGPGEPAVVPPLIPQDVNEAEQIFVVATAAESRPVVTDANGIEPFEIRDFPEETRGLDFLAPRLADAQLRSVAFRTLGAAAHGELRIERIERQRDPASGIGAGSDERTEPAAPEERSAGSAADVVSPVSLAVTARMTGLAAGFDHYVAEYRILRLADDARFRWTLPQPAEVIGVSLDGRRVVPVVQGTNYSVTMPPDTTPDVNQLKEVTTLAVEYRTPAVTHRGPNWRSLTFPRAERPVLHFHLALALPDGLRLDHQPRELSLAGFDEPLPWRRRLLGPFARPSGQPVFNPFGKESWGALVNGDDSRDGEQRAAQLWRGAAGAPPDEMQIVIWNSREVTWLSWVVLLLCLLLGAVARLAKAPLRRPVAIIGVAVLALLALSLPPVLAEFSGSALAGLILVVLLPQWLFVFAPRAALQKTAGVPVGSTQSFVPIAGLLLAVVGVGLGLTAEAQDDTQSTTPASSAAKKAMSRFVDVLIPVGADGNPAGKSPVAYVPGEFQARLKRLARPFELPAYLIGESTYHGAIDDANRLLVRARFEVHVLAGEPLVPVQLPLGAVNLGGKEASRVNGNPYPVIAGPGGRGLIVELPGADPLPNTPAIPEQDPLPELDVDGADEAEPVRADEPFPVQTYTIELNVYPAVEAGRAGVFSGTLTVPRGCQTLAELSSSSALPLLAISPAGSAASASRDISQASGKVAVRPGPSSQLVFLWSAAKETPSRAPAEVQVGVSCLADVAPALIQMRYHLAYRVQAGQMDSLNWNVPAGYVLETVQAPQLAGYRFEEGANGARRMLIEFSRPQTGDFSLAATFAVAVDRFEKQIPLPLLDPLRAEDSQKSQLSLRFHQFALRQPSDFVASISPVATEQPLKPRPVDDFLKEWNAAGARPQQAFDLERVFALNLSLESQPTIPAVRGSSIARFHPGHLDWTYNAEVAQSAIPHFLYRLHVDPRLRIRSVSVQEDGAERLLRWSQLRETVVLFLNDRATRSQAVRVEASLPLAAAQVIELPRIRFVGAIPGSERVTLYRDAEVTVRLANPEDFPQLEAGGSGPDARGDRLVGRVDVLPEQSNLRVAVEPVLPVVATEVATVLESRGDAWQFTTGVSFQVASGRVNEFTLEIPEALAARVETRSVPPSHISMQPAAGGRITLSFHPDEPALRRFVAILSGAADMSRAAWRLPSIEVSGSERTSTFLFTPRGAIEPAAAVNGSEAVPVPDWFKEIVPATATASLWNSYRWPGDAPESEFRPTRKESLRTFIDGTRIDLWIEHDGAIAGWLGMNLVGITDSHVEVAWPETARLTGLFVDGAFQPLPLPASGQCSIPVPPAASERLVWISWVDAPE